MPEWPNGEGLPARDFLILYKFVFCACVLKFSKNKKTSALFSFMADRGFLRKESELSFYCIQTRISIVFYKNLKV